MTSQLEILKFLQKYAWNRFDWVVGSKVGVVVWMQMVSEGPQGKALLGGAASLEEVCDFNVQSSN